MLGPSDRLPSAAQICAADDLLRSPKNGET
jgi:hypothetical protein